MPGQPASCPGTQSHAERSEEHPSELQSHSDLVCRPLLPKKKAVGLVVTCSIKSLCFSSAVFFSPIGPNNFSVVRSRALHSALMSAFPSRRSSYLNVLCADTAAGRRAPVLQAGFRTPFCAAPGRGPEATL